MAKDATKIIEKKGKNDMKNEILIGFMADKIAELAGVDKDHMKKCLGGIDDFTFGDMNAIAKVLGLSAADFDRAFFEGR